MKVTLIPGDGIGPEVSTAMKQVVQASGVNIEWDEVLAGEAVYNETGILIPEDVFNSLEANKIAIKGPMTTPIGKGFRSANVTLRKKYDLFANIRPIQSIGRVPALFSDLNLIIFRENTEDLYAGVEEKISDDEMHSIKIITRHGSERIIKAAFDYAKENHSEKVTVVTKANIMKLTDGMFLDIAREIQQQSYPDIPLEEVLVDNMCMQLVLDPNQYDVVVTQNLYGDIISDLMAGLVGGLGLVPGANIGKEMAIFESAHGSAPTIAGQNKANPTAMILSACLLLDHINEDQAADKIRTAIQVVLSDSANFTTDLGGQLSTTDFTEKIIQTIK